MIKPIRGTQLDMSHPLNRGLVACYDFNELSGNIVNDISGFRNHGDLINSPAWVPNIFGGGLDFDRPLQQYIDCGIALGNALGNNVSALAMSLWFKVNSTVSPAGRGMFNIGPFEGQHGEFGTTIFSSAIRFRMSNASFDRNISFTDISSWHHLFAQYTGSKGQLILDNSLVIDQPHSTNLDLSGLKTIIANYFAVDTSPFDGQIDLVRIYNKALLASEITQLFLRPDDLYLKDDIASWAFVPEIGYVLKYTNGSTGVQAHMRATNGVSGAEIVLKRTNSDTGDVINTSGA